MCNTQYYYYTKARACGVVWGEGGFRSEKPLIVFDHRRRRDKYGRVSRASAKVGLVDL